MRKNKKMIALFSAVLLVFQALPISADATHYETISAFSMPDWIPKSFSETMKFRNTYGYTHVEDDMICLVRTKSKTDKYGHSINDEDYCYWYDTKINDDLVSELPVSEAVVFDVDEKPVAVYQNKAFDVYTETFSFEMPLEDDPNYEQICEDLGIPADYKNNHFYESIISDNYDYEVTLIVPHELGTYDVTFLKGDDTDRAYPSTSYSFEVAESVTGEDPIIETDWWSFLPDCLAEYRQFSNQYGTVSTMNGYIIYCGYVAQDGGYSLVLNQTGTAKIEEILSASVANDSMIALDPGSSYPELHVYKPVTSGTIRTEFNQVRTWEENPTPVDQTVKAYEISSNGTIQEIDESQVMELNLGDCNLDGNFSLLDVIALKKWLVGAGSLDCWQNADLNGDNKINVIDLALMKQKLISQTSQIHPTVEIPDTVVLTNQLALTPQYSEIGIANGWSTISFYVRENYFNYDNLQETDVPFIQLYNADTGEMVAEMYDDGNSEHGDDTAGDRTWSCKAKVDARAEGQHHYFAVAGIHVESGSPVESVRSETTTLTVTEVPAP
ncbi:MAG: dockerin type I repeat-containing protein [Oscillospiraceae bacterium]